MLLFKTLFHYFPSSLRIQKRGCKISPVLGNASSGKCWFWRFLIFIFLILVKCVFLKKKRAHLIDLYENIS